MITMKKIIIGLIKELTSIKSKVEENVEKSQENQKKHHDRRKFKKRINVGDEALYYKAVKENNGLGN